MRGPGANFGPARMTNWALINHSFMITIILILHIIATGPMCYALCIMHLMSLRPMVVPMQKLCNMRIMHDDIMHYEKVNCIVSPVFDN